MLKAMYAPLTISQPDYPAELIFVFAGRPERKRYGWELFQRGVAPLLLLSVGRSEARFLRARAGLPEDGNIVRVLPVRPEHGNHIFLWADRRGMRHEVVRLAELNTFGEVAELRRVIYQHGLNHVAILSSEVHLRRIRYAVSKLLGATQVRITYLGVPEEISTCRRDRWWTRQQDAQLVIGEWIKLVGYHTKYGVFRWHRRYTEA